jgi:hypothetical protein
LLHARIEAIDLAQMKNDVLPFVKDRMAVQEWSKDLFHAAIDRMVGLPGDGA